MNVSATPNRKLKSNFESVAVRIQRLYFAQQQKKNKTKLGPASKTRWVLAAGHFQGGSQPRKLPIFHKRDGDVRVCFTAGRRMSSPGDLSNGAERLQPPGGKSCGRDLGGGAGSEGPRAASPGFQEEHLKLVWAFSRRRGRGRGAKGEG